MAVPLGVTGAQRKALDAASPALSASNPVSSTSAVSTAVAAEASARRRVSGAVMIPAVGATWVSRDQGASNQSNGTDTQMHTRKKHLAVAAATGFRIAFVNSYNFGGTVTNNTDSITVRCGLEIGGLFYPVWFNSGSRDVTIEPGGIAWGWCGIHVEAGDSIYSRTKVSVASAGMKWPIGFGESMNSSDEGATGTTSSSDLTTVSTAIGPNSNPGYFPAAMFAAAATPTRSVACIGDSIVAGKGDNIVAGMGGGWFVRAIGTSTPHYRVMPFSGATDGAWGASAASGTQVMMLAQGFHNIAVCELGINSITAGQSAANMQTRLGELWRQLQIMGMTVYQTTITPVTTSTDSWATTGNQTAAATNSVRTAVNDWIRTTPSPLTGYIEVADTVETARNSGIWKAAYTSDGTHPNGTGHPAIAAGIDLSTLA